MLKFKELTISSSMKYLWLPISTLVVVLLAIQPTVAELSLHHHVHHYDKNFNRKNGSKIIPTVWETKNDSEIALEVWDCNRAWPKLTLFTPFQTFDNSRDPHFYEIETHFSESFFRFWPQKISNTTVLLVYDAESINAASYKSIKTTLQKEEKEGIVRFIGIPQFPFYSGGHNRQQYYMFWASNFTDDPYIGFCDSDTVIVTYVDREDLFEDGKPIVNGRTGIMVPHVALWAPGSFAFLNILQPMTCMSYFPVIIKREHLIGLRKYIEKVHQMSFDEVFYNVTVARQIKYSQFGVMCTYIWTFHRDEYKWYIHSESPHWDGINPPPKEGQDGNVSQFSLEMYRPKPRIATHARYRYCKNGACPTGQIGWTNTLTAANFKYLIEQGRCRSPPFSADANATHSKCGIDQTKYWFELHNFEFINYAKFYEPEALDYETKIRYQRIKDFDGILK